MLRKQVAALTSPKITELLQLVGLPTTGTKSQKLQFLQSGLRASRLQSPKDGQPIRVLSVDMGIRNLAFSVLDIDPKSLGDAPVTQQRERDHFDLTDVLNQRRNMLEDVTLIDWRRIAVLDRLTPIKTSKKSTGFDESARRAPSNTANEDFSPSAFSKLTYNIVNDVFLPYNASHVLIERQRHRSGSGPAIQEWTVRVNIFEAMLHAVFETLRKEQKGPGQERRPGLMPDVHSIEPRKVAAFWCRPGATSGQEENTRERKDLSPSGSSQQARSSKIEKEQKVLVAEDWLEGGLACSHDAETTKNGFLEARRKRGTGKRSKGSLGKEVEKPKNANKLDDLADCLLQGIACVQWESNRRLLLRHCLD